VSGCRIVTLTQRASKKQPGQERGLLRNLIKLLKMARGGQKVREWLSYGRARAELPPYKFLSTSWMVGALSSFSTLSSHTHLKHIVSAIARQHGSLLGSVFNSCYSTHRNYSLRQLFSLLIIVRTPSTRPYLVCKSQKE
jgi:hypothetical protein